MRDGGVCSIGGVGWWSRASRQRTRAARLAILLAALVATWLTPAPAAAATTLEVEAGYGGSYVPGQPAPVRVRVTADRLLSGELQVVVDGPPTGVPIEVPGGTTKEFLVVMPTPSTSGGPIEVSVRLPDGTNSPPVASTSLSPAGDQEAVGLLPGALGGRSVPSTAPLAVDAGTARFVALGLLELERAPDSLFALGTIGVGADELARQAPSVRTGLLRWVESGGRLLVDAVPGTAVPGLPDAWQPGASNRARAGAGEIRLTAGAMAEGRWSGLVEPTGRLSGSAIRIGSPPLGDLLASEAGFRLPEISWLVGFLVLYVAAVGPVLYMVLRRRGRPELAWVAIPLIAVVFTAASYAGGRSLRNATPVVHGTIVGTGVHGSTALAYLGISSRSGGTPRLTYPAGWLAGGGEDLSGDRSPLTSVRLTASGSEGRLPLDAGQFAVVSAWGPAGVEGSLEVTAGSDADGVVRGTVRNGTRLPLVDVALISGNGSTGVGTLAAGEQREWTLRQAAFQGGPPADFTMWQFAGGDGVEARERWTSIALWNAAQRVGLVARDGGQVVAVGSTRDFVPPIRVGGRLPRSGGKALIVGSGPVTATGTRATDASVQAEMVRVAGHGGPGLGVRSTVVRFGLPALDHAFDPARLLLRIPAPTAEVWTGSEWTAVTCSPPACGAGPAPNCPPGVVCAAPYPGMVLNGPFAEMPVPAGGVRDGAVYVRFRGGVPSGPTGDIVGSLRETS